MTLRCEHRTHCRRTLGVFPASVLAGRYHYLVGGCVDARREREPGCRARQGERVGSSLPAALGGRRVSATDRLSSQFLKRRLSLTRAAAVSRAAWPDIRHGVLASLDLFTAGRRGAQRRAADAERTAADASLVDRTYGARLTVEVAFLDVLRASDLIKVSGRGSREIKKR